MLQYAEEHFKDVAPEIADLAPEHFDEVSDYVHVGLDVDWDRFAELDAGGFIKVLSVRDDGKLVGYVIFLVSKGLHYKNTLIALDDAFFLARPYRKAWNGIRMFQCAEKMLRFHGVQLVRYHEKIKVPCGKVFEYLGYKPQEIMWFKELV